MRARGGGRNKFISGVEGNRTAASSEDEAMRTTGLQPAGMNPAELANIAENERDHWWYRGMREILHAMLSRHLAGKRISLALEAGCGTGYTADWVQRRYGWKVVPVDIESTALRYMRNVKSLDSAQADVRLLPFRDTSFDIVLSFDVLVHLSPGDERKCLAEFFRVTAPGGLLVLRAAAFDALRSRHSEFIEEKQRFTRGALTRAVVEHGFRVLECSYANSLLLPVALAKFRIWEPLLRKPPASGVEEFPGWLNKLLYAVLGMEAKWIRWGQSIPLGQSLMLIAEKPAAKSN